MTEAMLLYDFALIVKEHGRKQYVCFARTVSPLCCHTYLQIHVVGVIMLTKYRPGDYWPVRPCSMFKQITRSVKVMCATELYLAMKK